MATFHAIRTARLTDRQILDLIYSLVANAGVTSGTIRLGDGLDIDITAGERSEKPIADLDGDRHAIQAVYLFHSSHLRIELYRGICGDVQKPGGKRQASQYFDEVFLTTDGKLGVDAVQKWIACIDAIEQAVPKSYPLQESENGTDVIDVLRAEVGLLSGQYQRMLTGLAEERTQFRERFEAERAAAREEYTTKKRELENAAAGLREEFNEHKAQEDADLIRRQEELEQREQDLDNRQHMHARRDLREKISEDFRSRIGNPVVSGSASRMRWLVFLLTLMSGLGIGFFGIQNFAEMVAAGGDQGAGDWLTVSYAARSIVLTVVAVGFIAYAINWLRTVYLDDVRAQRRYEKYGHDIDRASFVVETIMEVGDKENMQVPDAWIDGVCRNLFHESADRNSDESPSSALAALFESIAGAKFGPSGTELTMERRDARGLAKKVARG